MPDGSDKTLIIVMRRDGILAPIYYRYFDSDRGRALFGDKRVAVRMTTDMATSVRSQLRALSYDVVVMDCRTRFSSKLMGG